MPQTTIRQSRAGAFAGQLREELGPTMIRTAIVAAGKTVRPGQPCVIVSAANADGNGVTVRAIENGDTLNGRTVLGIVRADTFRENEDYAGYAAGKTVSVVRRGVVFMRATAGVTAMNAVYVGNATAQLGNVDDATGTGLVAYPGAQFLASGSADDLVPVFVDTTTPTS